MSAPDPSPNDTLDPRPQPPREPQLEDCCASGCVHCVFDMYQIAREKYECAFRAWESRQPDQASPSNQNRAMPPKATASAHPERCNG
nr:oxidoreductase-like domain-containing protein [uncultured Massilia sp.]